MKLYYRIMQLCWPMMHRYGVPSCHQLISGCCASIVSSILSHSPTNHVFILAAWQFEWEDSGSIKQWNDHFRKRNWGGNAKNFGAIIIKIVTRFLTWPISFEMQESHGKISQFSNVFETDPFRPLECLFECHGLLTKR